MVTKFERIKADTDDAIWSITQRIKRKYELTEKQAITSVNKAIKELYDIPIKGQTKK